MLFEFLKYLQPTHYFGLSRLSQGCIFPNPKDLPKDVFQQLHVHNGYITDAAIQYDLSWQALHGGYIGKAAPLDRIVPLPLEDNYRFIRRYFNKAWVFYVLLLRVLSFNNPFKEIRAWFATRKVKRNTYLDSVIPFESWEDFRSDLVNSQPKVSVIIPTLNRYDYLKDVLSDLENQDYTNFEVLIVDQSEPFNEAFYADYKLDVSLIHQLDKALWLARNTAVKQAKGDYLLFFDDDSRVASTWITNHLKCLDFFKADVSSGVSISKMGAEIPGHYSFFKVSDQLDTGNALVKKSVFKNIGLFDRQFEEQRMGDGEFGLRVYLNGFLNVSNPYAQRLHLKVGTGGLREMGSWDAFRTKKWLAPKPIPSVLYFFRGYFGHRLSKYALLRTVPLSIMPYRFKKNKGMLILGVLVSFCLIPIVLFQVCKSWKLASKKLRQGPLIDMLE